MLKGIIGYKRMYRARLISMPLPKGASNVKIVAKAIQITSAEGEDLDEIGFEWSGLRRKLPSAAHTTYEEKNVLFCLSGRIVNGNWGLLKSST